MVIGDEFYPPIKHEGYAHVEEYYQNPKKSYAHMEEDYYAKDNCYNTTSSLPLNMKGNPYMISPQPIKHGLVAGQEGYAYHQDNYNYGGGQLQAQKNKFQEIQAYGGTGKHSNGMNFGEQQGLYGRHPPTGLYGNECLAKGKLMNGIGMHHNNGSYETAEHESYTHMGPNRYESASYDYRVESPNNYAHKNKKNWAAAGAEWISKGL